MRPLLRRAVALLGGILSVGTATAAPLRADQQAFRDIFRELVETDTSAESGSCTLAAERMLKRLRDAGFGPGEAEVFVPEGRPKDGGLIAHIPGRDAKAPAILLVDHIDVVTARREDWTRDPYKLGEEGGYFIGRGVIDDKALVAIWIDSFLRMKAEGFRPRRTLKLAATCGEESGGAVNGVQWLIQNRPDAVKAGFALNEGGHGMADAEGKPVALLLAVGEKLSANFTVEARNPGGHSSRPRPDNAIYDLSAALLKLRDFGFPIQQSPTVTAYLNRMGPITGGEKGQAMQAFASGKASEAQRTLVLGDTIINAMLRNTCVATELNGGHAVNALPQRARATIQCRLLPGQRTSDVFATLKQVMGAGVTVTPVGEIKDEPAAFSPPLDPALLSGAEAVAREQFPGVPVIPNLLTAGTDGRYLSAAGISTYGVPGITLDADGNGAHGINERVRVDSLYAGRDYLYALIKLYSAR